MKGHCVFIIHHRPEISQQYFGSFDESFEENSPPSTSKNLKFPCRCEPRCFCIQKLLEVPQNFSFLLRGFTGVKLDIISYWQVIHTSVRQKTSAALFFSKFENDLYQSLQRILVFLVPLHFFGTAL